MYSIYGIDTEIVGHVLWSCPSAKDVWLDCPKMIQKCSSDEDAFINIFKRLMGRLVEDYVQWIAFAAQ
jgi:hypothetical protein